jgi:hypothetical protein
MATRAEVARKAAASRARVVLVVIARIPFGKAASCAARTTPLSYPVWACLQL